MKSNIIDGLLLAVVGALFIDLSLSGYHANTAGLIIGALLMLPGLYSVIHDLWTL